MHACRSIIASQDIKAEEVVVEVPDDSVLMSENSTISEELEGEIAAADG